MTVDESKKIMSSKGMRFFAFARMKKILIAAIVFCILLMCAACTDNTKNGAEQPNGTERPSVTESPDESENPNETDPPIEDEKEITKMYVSVDGYKLEVTLEKNSSVDALVEILKQGDLSFTAYENGGFEIYGNIGHTLPTNNTQMSAQAGDVILYAGNNICLFFGNNSWSYTKIGKINGYSAQQLKTMLVADGGSVQVTIGLN